MNQENITFLSFNDKPIVYKRIKGVYWISIKTVCEALNVNYNRQFQNLKEDRLLKAEYAKQQMQVPNDQSRSLICLPETFIYGWIFSLNSKSEELLLFKKECYLVLFKHFNGSITRKTELYKELAKEKKRIEELETTLRANSEFQEWADAKMRTTRLWKNIHEVTNDETYLFNDEDF